MLFLAFGCSQESPGDQDLPEVRGINFTERALEVGLTFEHLSGREGELWTLEITGAGVGVLDYNQDGLLDVYFVQGGPIRDRTVNLPSDQLFRNVSTDGTLRFEDVSVQAGITGVATHYGMGIATGDIDNDGDLDIFLANFGMNQLLENQGAQFVDISEHAGLGGKDWSISASFGDYNNDGLLDVYVANYLVFPPIEEYEPCFRVSRRRTYCAPSNFEAVPDRLYLNLGDRRFQNVSRRSGISDFARPGMGVASVDVNSDRLVDIYVANDNGENFLWLNQGDATFVDDALFQGVAVNGDGRQEASMGIAVGDFNADGQDDFFVTHDIKESNTYYVSDPVLGYVDSTSTSGLATASMATTGFGTDWIDADNDGRREFFVANGSVSMIESQIAAGIEVPLKQHNQIWQLLTAKSEYRLVPGGSAFEQERVSRGAAFGDLDNDGDIDVVIANNDDRATLYLNESTLADGTSGDWIGFDLNRDDGRQIFGAEVRIVGSDQRLGVQTDASYASANDSRLVFGLGSVDEPQSLSIEWPDGSIQNESGLAVNRYHVIQQE